MNIASCNRPEPTDRDELCGAMKLKSACLEGEETIQ